MNMNVQLACVIVSSLLARFRRDGEAFVLPEGRISSIEMEAIRHLLTDGKPVVPTTEHPADTIEKGDRARGPTEGNEEITTQNKKEYASPPETNLPNLQAATAIGPEESDMRLCIDFGTAMSKAWAALDSIEKTLPLNLGKAAGGKDRFTLPSAIFISAGERVFFGDEAEAQHRQELDDGRRIFDNIKRILSETEVGLDLNEVPVDKTIDPTDAGITKGDLLVLYLGWLTDSALAALKRSIEEEHGKIDEAEDTMLRSIRRRFAIPCFENAVDELNNGETRSKWAKKVLSESMIKAQVAADSFRSGWDRIRLPDVLPTLRAIREIDTERFEHLLAECPTVREPVAAGASRFGDEMEQEIGQSRRILFVVDAGAGTTDFAVFQAFVDSEMEDGVRYALITPTVKMCRIAGNEIDAILRPIFLTTAGINPNNGAPRSEGDFSLISRDLSSQIRMLKEILFFEGTVEYALRPGIRAKLDIETVLNDGTYKQRGEELLTIRQNIMRGVFSDDYLSKIKAANLRTGKPMPVHVLLTGGSASVPIIERLASGSLELNDAKFEFRRVRALPEWIENLERELLDQISDPNPQCAVAIGGSAPALPSELSDLKEVITPGPGGRWEVQRFQSQGI